MQALAAEFSGWRRRAALESKAPSRVRYLPFSGKKLTGLLSPSDFSRWADFFLDAHNI
jgi:hypothetical protein